ncbi:MAG: zinc ribbon domain-containing protein [Clostridia bacterium]
MYCEKCGKTLAENAKFCDDCGTRVTPPETMEAIKPEQSTTPPPPPVPATPPPPPPPKPVQQTNQYTYGPGANAVSLDKPLSVGAYLGMFILLAIPIVNIIMVFVWAFGGSTNKNKKNYAIAVMILVILGIILSIVMAITMGSLFATLFRDMDFYY